MTSDSLEDRERRILERLNDQVREVDDQVREFLGIPASDSSTPEVNWRETDLHGLNGYYRWYYADAEDADEITIGRHHEVDTLFHELIHYHADMQEWKGPHGNDGLEARWGVVGLEEGLTELLADEYYDRHYVRCKCGREMAETLLHGLESNGYTHDEAIALLANLHQDPTTLPTVMEAAGVDSLGSSNDDDGSSAARQTVADDDESLDDPEDQDADAEEGERDQESDDVFAKEGVDDSTDEDDDLDDQDEEQDVDEDDDRELDGDDKDDDDAWGLHEEDELDSSEKGEDKDEDTRESGEEHEGDSSEEHKWELEDDDAENDAREGNDWVLEDDDGPDVLEQDKEYGDSDRGWDNGGGDSYEQSEQADSWDNWNDWNDWNDWGDWSDWSDSD